MSVDSHTNQILSVDRINYGFHIGMSTLKIDVDNVGINKMLMYVKINSFETKHKK